MTTLADAFKALEDDYVERMTTMNKTSFPIHVDRNVSPSHFAGSRLAVTSIFRTIQGEGPFAGYPATFLRMAGCNLGAKKDCPFCDTYFAVDEAKSMTVTDVEAELYRLMSTEAKRDFIVVTGGEPLLQWSNIVRLITQRDERVRMPTTWQFETNGYYLRRELLKEALELDTALGVGELAFVVSPKVSSTLGRYPDVDPALYAKAHEAGLLYLKFVVSADASNPYHELPSWLPLVDVLPQNVFISGMTCYDDPEQAAKPGTPARFSRFSPTAQAITLENNEYAAKLAIQHGYRFSLQSHLYAGIE